MIKIDDDYFVEVNDLNFTLKHKYIATKKETGEQYERYENVGYYSNLKSAVEGYLDQKERKCMANAEMSLEQALTTLRTSRRSIHELLERLVDDGK